MSDRFLRSMLTVAIAATAVGAVISLSITETSAQAPAASATTPVSALKTSCAGRRTAPAAHATAAHGGTRLREAIAVATWPADSGIYLRTPSLSGALALNDELLVNTPFA